MIEILAGITAGIVISAIVGAWLNGHRNRMEKLRHHRNSFFEAAHTALVKDEIDDERLKRLKLMSEDMDTRAAFFELLSATRAFEREYRNRPFVAKEPRAGSAEWTDVVFHYFLAVSYSRAILGGYFRSILAGVLDPRFGAFDAEDIDRRVHSRAPTPRPVEHVHA